jgi:hypothetical protein
LINLDDFLPLQSYPCGCIELSRNAFRSCLRADCKNFEQIKEGVLRRASREVDKVNGLSYEQYELKQINQEEDDNEDDYEDE